MAKPANIKQAKRRAKLTGVSSHNCQESAVRIDRWYRDKPILLRPGKTCNLVGIDPTESKPLVLVPATRSATGRSQLSHSHKES
jgi:hypothetical protein